MLAHVERDPKQWAVVLPHGLVYAQRPTKEECLRVIVEQEHLIRYFGWPAQVVPPIVTELPVRRAF